VPEVRPLSSAWSNPAIGLVPTLLSNRLGSIITAVSVSTGAIAAEYDYQAYGPRVETAALEQPYGFTGREHDAESSLVHFRTRAYDPETGAFLQADPAGFGGEGLNLYLYVGDDPLNWVDPTGQRRAGAGSQAQELLSTAGVGMASVGLIGSATLERDRFMLKRILSSYGSWHILVG
jgi:RHS repeat-associated protein